MKGDFSRDTFDPGKHFLRVLDQQGRVQLDAERNEQTSILLYRLQAMTRDVLGPHCCFDGGFQIGVSQPPGQLENRVSVRQGRCYVQGLLCENLVDGPLYGRTGYWRRDNPPDGTIFVAYLDVWERHITCVEDEDIRERALNGPDTTTRSQLVWQVRFRNVNIPREEVEKFKTDYQGFLDFLGVDDKSTPRLTAAVGQINGADNGACYLAGESKYRGLENQLYRVEIHDTGPLGVATWKWSRDNGSVVFPLADEIKTEGGTTTVVVEHFGRDRRFGLKVNDLVELVDDDYVLNFQSAPLFKVREIRQDEGVVVLDGTPAGKVGEALERHPLLRRWDHKSTADSGVLDVQEDDFTELEDGVRCKFVNPNGVPRMYTAGDYWLIPARVATGNVEWPKDESRPPRGILHYYAPLAYFDLNQPDDVLDLRNDPSSQQTLTLTPAFTKNDAFGWDLTPQGVAKPQSTAARGLIRLTLPNGAELNALAARGRLEKPGKLEISLKRQEVSGVCIDLKKIVITGPKSFDVEPAWESIGPPAVIIDNAKYSYFIEAFLENSPDDSPRIMSLQVGFRLGG
jgi:hypothetical protein